MVNINSGSRHLRLTPYERIEEPEEPSFDWINVWVEFSIPELKTEFKTAFTVSELKILKKELENLYQSLKAQRKNPNVLFNSLEKQVILNFRKPKFGDHIGIDLLIRPEDHADSVILKDFFGIDESYFPALLSGLDAMINWQN